jgi:hypothetical protein
MDASNLLKPALASGTVRCIGSTTYKEYRQYFEKDRALVRRFQKIDVNELAVGRVQCRAGQHPDVSATKALNGHCPLSGTVESYLIRC